MAQSTDQSTAAHPQLKPGWDGFVADWSSDQRSFKTASWHKAMMWIFLLSDTFIFGTFLLSYMTCAHVDAPFPGPTPARCSRCISPASQFSAAPDRHHDLHADHEQRHHGAGGQLRLPQEPCHDRRLPC